MSGSSFERLFPQRLMLFLREKIEMMKIEQSALPASADRALMDLQLHIDSHPTFPERVERARQRFSAENRAGNPTFDAVRKTLVSMCCGASRCMYCEDSAADEIEHFRPKCFYPHLVFVWLNYLYACGACNRAKSSHFRILSGNGEYIDLAQKPGAMEEPASGAVVLLDPRVDDPLKFLSLDLIDTFHFVPRYEEGTVEHARAEYTIARLKLNERDILPFARREAFGHYQARLREYIGARGTPVGERLAAAIRRCGHPTVWAEMKAQSPRISNLRELFAAAPEAREL
jgi:uncharacterized protein (TIGR02646 family)